MPTCKNCKNKWNWKQTVSRTTTFNSPMTCPCFGKKQYQTMGSKVKIVILNLIIYLPLHIQAFLDVSKILLISLFAALDILVSYISFISGIKKQGKLYSRKVSCSYWN